MKSVPRPNPSPRCYSLVLAQIRPRRQGWRNNSVYVRIGKVRSSLHPALYVTCVADGIRDCYGLPLFTVMSLHAQQKILREGKMNHVGISALVC
jgi:hypothetical protein